MLADILNIRTFLQNITSAPAQITEIIANSMPIQIEDKGMRRASLTSKGLEIYNFYNIMIFIIFMAIHTRTLSQKLEIFSA
jgi:hypothetical protein